VDASLLEHFRKGITRYKSYENDDEPGNKQDFPHGRALDRLFVVAWAGDIEDGHDEVPLVQPRGSLAVLRGPFVRAGRYTGVASP
jgi:hypothetical protein